MWGVNDQFRFLFISAGIKVLSTICLLQKRAGKLGIDLSVS